MTEAELIRRCSEQDGVAQQELYNTYAAKMLGVCARYMADHDQAQDVMHDGFITVFEKIGSFRREGSFEGWLRRVFVNTALGHLRKNNALKQALPVESITVFDENEVSAVEQMQEKELLRCIGELPDGYRTVLNLFAVEGYAHREIAELLGISEGTSRSQYARAKTYLYKVLKEAGAI